MKKNINRVLPSNAGKDQEAAGKTIHVLLEETIAERRKLLIQWEQTCMNTDTSPDIHSRLAKTIAQYKIEKQYWSEKLFPPEKNKISATEKKAA